MKESFGCSNCYFTFEDELEPIIKNLQGNVKYIGKSPNPIAKKLNKMTLEDQEKMQKLKMTPNEKLEEQIRIKENLEEKLKQAIKLEDYEEAARLRDEIKKVDAKNTNKEDKK